MKKLFTVSFVALSAFYSLKAQTFTDAVDYLNYFNQEFAGLQQFQMDYMSAAIHLEGEEVDEARNKLKTAVDNAQAKFNAVAPFAKDNGLRQNAIKTINEVKALSDADYSEAVKKKVKCTDCFEAELYENELIKKDGKELDKAFNKMSKSIDEFAKANEIKMLSGKDEGDIAIEKFNKVSDYLRELNLVVLQLQYANDKIINALNANDISTAEKEVKKLRTAYNEAKSRFSTVKRITEDANCINKVSGLLNHYEQCVEKFYPQMLSAFDKKGQIINEKVDLFNKNIDKVNNVSAVKLNEYQQARIELLQRHTPRPQQKVFKS
jgi:lysophospholipase L1-like esterase